MEDGSCPKYPCQEEVLAALQHCPGLRFALQVHGMGTKLPASTNTLCLSPSLKGYLELQLPLIHILVDFCSFPLGILISKHLNK